MGGTHGILYVHEDCRRRGLGSLVIKALARQQAGKEHETLSSVVFDNDKSIRVFKSLGFHNIDKVHWFKTQYQWDQARFDNYK